METQANSTIARHSHRLDFNGAPAPQSNFQKEGSGPDHSDFMHSDSVYMDSKISQSITDDTFMSQPANSAKIESDIHGTDPNAKPHKSRREERQQRIAAEQAAWLRTKFELPPSDLLLTSFSAALFRHILLQGRMYITTSMVCFYTRIFGKVTKEAFPFVNMSHVKKRKGGLVANAIKIYFKNDKDNEPVPPILIGSLNHREKAFNAIQSRLRELNPLAAEPKETPGEDEGSGASVGSARADSDEHYPDANDSNSINPNSTSNAQPPHAPRGAAHANNAYGNGANTSLNNNPSRDSDSSASLSQGSSCADAGHCGAGFVWRTREDPVDRVAGNACAKKTEQVRGVINAPVKTVLNVLFVSDWLKQYHQAVNNREVTFSNWGRGEDGFMVREVNFRRPMGYKIGPKETRVREKHRYSFMSDGGALLEITTTSLDAPYGNSFVIETFHEMLPHKDGSQTMLISSVAVHFTKDLWALLQGKIESTALSETKGTCMRLSELATRKVHEYMAETRTGGQSHSANGDNIRAQNGCQNTEPSLAPDGPSRKQRASLKPVTLTCALKEVATTGADGHIGEKCDGQIETDLREEAVSTGNASALGDLQASKWMKIAVGMLIFLCLVLVGVLMLLSRLQHTVRVLEKTVTSKYGDVANEVCGNAQTF